MSDSNPVAPTQSNRENFSSLPDLLGVIDGLLGLVTTKKLNKVVFTTRNTIGLLES